MAHPQHETLRQLFQFRCGYCGTSEQQAGGELTVDHYQPLSAQGSDDLENLAEKRLRSLPTKRSLKK